MARNNTSKWAGIALTVMVLMLLTVSTTLAAAPTGHEEGPFPPPPLIENPLEVSISIDDATVNSRTGEATVTVTVTCSEPAQLFYVDAMVRQQVGRFEVIRFGGAGFGGPGYGDPTPLTCDGEQTLTLTTTNGLGLLKGGKAEVRVSTFGCTESPYMFDPWPEEPVFGPENCDYAEGSVTLRLRPSR
jgi:hypothetical protein